MQQAKQYKFHFSVLQQCELALEHALIVRLAALNHGIDWVFACISMLLLTRLVDRRVLAPVQRPRQPQPLALTVRHRVRVVEQFFRHVVRAARRCAARVIEIFAVVRDVLLVAVLEAGSLG